MSGQGSWPINGKVNRAKPDSQVKFNCMLESVSSEVAWRRKKERQERKKAKVKVKVNGN